MVSIDRRRFLTAVGSVTVAGIAGCSDGGDGSGPSIDDYPAIDTWLTETTVGAADDTYDGSLTDRTGQATVTIDVGAAGNGGDYAFAPSAVAISTGTTVEFDWTGRGQQHNAEAIPNEQIQESDYTFSSGEPVDSTGVQFTYTFDQAGIALYHCEPHLPLGMKGGIAVV